MIVTGNNQVSIDLTSEPFIINGWQLDTVELGHAAMRLGAKINDVMHIDGTTDERGIWTPDYSTARLQR